MLLMHLYQYKTILYFYQHKTECIVGINAILTLIQTILYFYYTYIYILFLSPPKRLKRIKNFRNSLFSRKPTANLSSQRLTKNVLEKETYVYFKDFYLLQELSSMFNGNIRE